MRVEVAWTVVRLAAVASLPALVGCSDPLDRMCTARADYFDSCAGVATDQGWNLVKDYSFYGLSGREDFVQACTSQGEARADVLADDTERKRLKIAFEDEALKYELLVSTQVCAQVP